MSAQAGIFRRDFRPVNQAEVMEMVRQLEDLGPDGGGEYMSGCVGMGYRAFNITPESEFENQPLVAPDRTILTWDGRLDNRDDLCLQLHASLTEERSDAAIVMAAWERWGRDTFHRLLGDWALAVWDSSDRSLYLARDYAGVRPLYWGEFGTDLYWSTEFSGLVGIAHARLGRSPTIDESWIAGFLAFGPDMDRTPFSEIHCVLPGHYLVANHKSINTSRYWACDGELQIRYRSDAEYEEHFRELFRGAVRARLRAKGPVWSHLSGGLDSSSITCMADDIMAAESAPTPRVETVSCVYDTSPESDERSFINTVEVQRGRVGNHFSDRDYPALIGEPPARILLPAMVELWIGCQRAICEAMQTDGARVQLSGEGGDELMGNIVDGIPQVLDSLSAFRLGRACNHFVAWTSARKQSRVQVLKEVVGGVFQHLIGSGSHLSPDLQHLASFVDRRFADRTEFRKRLEPVGEPYGMRWPSARLRATSLLIVIARVSADGMRPAGCIGMTYPFLDRRLVTFLLGIPIEQLATPRERRSLMRRALYPLLPQEIAKRRSKKSPDASIYRAIGRGPDQLSVLTGRPRVVANGYIDSEALCQGLDRVRAGLFPVPFIAKALVLERWLRRLEWLSPALVDSSPSEVRRGLASGEQRYCITNSQRKEVKTL